MLKLRDGFRGERALVLPRMILEKMEKDPLLSLLYVTDIGYYPCAAHHYRERKEPLGQFVLIYCLDGKGFCRIGTDVFSVKSHQYIILPADKSHAYYADEDEPWTIYWIHFAGKMAKEYTAGSGQPIDIEPGRNSRINHRIELFEEIFLTLKLGFSVENLRYVSAALHYFLATFSCCSSYRNAISSPDEDNIRAMVHYMEENIGRKLTLADMADYAGYSSSYFSTIFSEMMGEGPLAYFNRLKMLRACELLDFTDMRINQICYKIGMDDPYYFSRLFKQIIGVSPRAYRRNRC